MSGCNYVTSIKKGYSAIDANGWHMLETSFSHVPISDMPIALSILWQDCQKDLCKCLSNLAQLPDLAKSPLAAFHTSRIFLFQTQFWKRYGKQAIKLALSLRQQGKTCKESLITPYKAEGITRILLAPGDTGVAPSNVSPQVRKTFEMLYDGKIATDEMREIMRRSLSNTTSLESIIASFAVSRDKMEYLLEVVLCGEKEDDCMPLWGGYGLLVNFIHEYGDIFPEIKKHTYRVIRHFLSRHTEQQIAESLLAVKSGEKALYEITGSGLLTQARLTRVIGHIVEQENGVNFITRTLSYAGEKDLDKFLPSIETWKQNFLSHIRQARETSVTYDICTAFRIGVKDSVFLKQWLDILISNGEKRSARKKTDVFLHRCHANIVERIARRFPRETTLLLQTRP